MITKRSKRRNRLRGSQRVAAANEVILKVVNTSSFAQDTELNLLRAGEVQSQAIAIVLTANNPADENSLNNPDRSHL